MTPPAATDGAIAKRRPAPRAGIRRGLFTLAACAAWAVVSYLFAGRGTYVPLAALSAAVLAVAWRTSWLDGAVAPTLARVSVGFGLGAILVLLTHALYPVAADLSTAIRAEVVTLYGELDQWPGRWAGLVLVVPIAAAEEAIHRGVAFDWLRTRGRVAAVAGSALLYAAVTAASGSLLLTVVALALGVVWAVERLILRDLASVVATHLTWTVAVMFLWPLEVVP